jgi:hypothetical protein
MSNRQALWYGFMCGVGVLGAADNIINSRGSTPIHVAIIILLAVLMARRSRKPASVCADPDSASNPAPATASDPAPAPTPALASTSDPDPDL